MQGGFGGFFVLFCFLATSFSQAAFAISLSFGKMVPMFQVLGLFGQMPGGLVSQLQGSSVPLQTYCLAQELGVGASSAGEEMEALPRHQTREPDVNSAALPCLFPAFQPPAFN